MRSAMPLIGSVLLFAAPAVAQDTHRELGPHEHGRGTLNIAVEGKRVNIELEVPGMDIVGFEHPAKTAAQKKTVGGAKSTLGRPLALFKLPSAAGCRLREAKVDLATEDHDHAADEGKDAEAGAPGKKKQDASAKEKEHGQHTEFHAEYALECANPSAITSIDFDYFKSFSSAQKLDVNVITSKGQSRFEVSRDKPRLELGGLV